jgi:tetratricopeptide (TPR) repeat protein
LELDLLFSSLMLVVIAILFALVLAIIVVIAFGSRPGSPSWLSKRLAEAEVARQRKKIDRRTEPHRRAMLEAIELGRPVQAGDAAMKCGEVLLDMNVKDESAAAYEKAAALYLEAKRLEMASDAYRKAAYAWDRCHMSVDAINMYRKTIEIEEQLDRPQVLLECFRMIAWLSEGIGDAEESERMYLKTLELCQEQKRWRLAAETCRELASLRERSGNLNGANDVYQRALDIERSNNNVDGVVNLLLTLGSLRQKAGNALEAERTLREALRIAEELESSEIEFIACVALADIVPNMDHDGPQPVDELYDRADGAERSIAPLDQRKKHFNEAMSSLSTDDSSPWSDSQDAYMMDVKLLHDQRERQTHLAIAFDRLALVMHERGNSSRAKELWQKANLCYHEYDDRASAVMRRLAQMEQDA